MALRKLNKIAAAFAVTMAMGAAHAESISFSRLYALGDSLTDGGAYSGAVFLGSGSLLPNIRYRFTNNALDGSSRVYAEDLAERLGLPLPPRFVNLTGPNDPDSGADGATYAQGGARVLNPTGIGNSPPGITTVPVKEQVDQLLLDSPNLSNKDLVVLWAGANDGFVQFGAVIADAVTPTTATGNMVAASGDLAAQIDRIKNAGGKNVVVILVPDLAKTPFGQLVIKANASGGVLLSTLSEAFNQTLKTAAAQRNVFVFDSNRVLGAIIDDPVRYGFNANTLGATACGNNETFTGPNDFYKTSLTCISSNPSNFVYADGVHPSAQGHEIFGEILMGSLRAISQASTLATGPMIAARQHSMELENRLHLDAMSNADGKARAVGKVHVYGGAEAGGFKGSAGQIDPSVDMKTQRYRIGIDQQFSTSTMGGVLLSYGNGKTDFGGGTGQIKTDEVTATLYASKALSKNTYVNASYGMGTVDHDFQRNIALDTTTLSMTSSPKGRYESLRVGGGGIYNMGGWKLGPNASLAHEKVTIERFDEAAGPASMSFGAIDYTVQRFSLGLSLDQTASLGQWRGFGRLVHDWDLKSGDLKVSVGHAAGTLASFDIERPKTMWQASLGIMRPAADGSTLSFSVGLGGRDGGGDTRTIGVNYRIEL